jgi:hypothetical protein
MDRIFDGIDRVEACKETYHIQSLDDEKRVLEEVEARDFS